MCELSGKDGLKAFKPVAILVDGGFFLKRYRVVYKNGKTHTPSQVAKNLYTMLMRHVDQERLYRILFYNCPPLSKKAHNPITNKSIDFLKTDQAQFMIEFHDELKKLRKVALRLGHLKDYNSWVIRPHKTKKLLKKQIDINDLTESDIFFDIRQKGVDMKIALDIASLAYKKLVDKIILASGDSDFVPAAKLARREGIDFILDPMWHHISPSLYEHIDGLRSTCNNPSK